MGELKIKSMNITVGYSCNNNCMHCLIGLDQKDIWTDKTTETLKKELLKAKREEVEQVTFIGGEITIRDDFFELLDFAKKNRIHINLETNARMFSNPLFAEKTFGMMPNLNVSMSFHHSKESVHDQITRVQGSFRQSVLGIRNMKIHGLKHLAVIAVITKKNYKNLPELVNFLAGIGVDQIDFTLLRIGGNAQKNLNKVFVRIGDIQPYLFEAIEAGEKRGIRIRTYGFPYCTIKGYEKHACEVDFIQTSLEGKTYIFNELYDPNIDWQKERRNIKAKLKSCKKCCCFNFCEGLWKEYFGLGATAELVPVKSGLTSGWVKTLQEHLVS